MARYQMILHNGLMISDRERAQLPKKMGSYGRFLECTNEEDRIGLYTISNKTQRNLADGIPSKHDIESVERAKLELREAKHRKAQNHH